MDSNELKSFVNILERVPQMSRPMRVILAGSDGENMLKGLFAAQKKGLVQPVLGFRGLFEAMSLVAIVALAAYLFVSRKHGTMRRRLREVDES